VRTERIFAAVARLVPDSSSLAGFSQRQGSGVFFPPDVTITGRREVIALAERYRLPALYSEPVFAQNGGLVFYGADRLDLFGGPPDTSTAFCAEKKSGDLRFSSRRNTGWSST
jgi:hypothetical protein